MTTTTKYSFGKSLNHPDRMCVRVEFGAYEGSIFSISKLFFDEDKEDFVCNYDVELHMLNGSIPRCPANMKAFSEQAVRPIVIDFLEDIARKTSEGDGKPSADAL